VDKEALFTPRLPEDDVEVPNVGTVRVRGLSRIEAMHVQAANGTEATERRMLALGLVDPKLTEAEAGKWQDASPAGELEAVTDRIAELSGMKPEAVKEAVKAFEADPEAEFRVLPSGGTGDDGGSAPGGTEQ
jgi:hypothetical protein